MKNVINFTKYYTRKKGGVIMCNIIKNIKGKTPIELLTENQINIEPPINLSELLNKIGISTIAKDFSEIEELGEIEQGSILGAAFSSGDNLTIFYKKTDSVHRKKFTIAHELAHCCLHCPQNESSHIEFRIHPFTEKITKEEVKKEREANIFAGELLIPEQSLKMVCEKLLVPSLTELSKIFDVSTSVMAARLDYLKMPYYKDSSTEIII